MSCHESILFRPRTLYDITRMLTMVLFWWWWWWWQWWEYCYNPWILKLKSDYFLLIGTCQVLWFSQLWFKGCFIGKKIRPSQEKSWNTGMCFVFNISTARPNLKFGKLPGIDRTSISVMCNMPWLMNNIQINSW